MPTEDHRAELVRARVVTQRLFAGCAALVAVFVVLGVPAAHTADTFWAGCALVSAATLAAFVLPRRRLMSSWWIVVPGLDLIAVGLLRAELVPTMTGLAGLVVIPAIWLGADFGRVGVAVAGLGGFFVFAMPAVGPPELLGSTADLGRLLLQELQTAGLALFGHMIAAELRRRERRLDLELQSSRRRNLMGRAVLNGVGSGVIVYDADGRLLVANALARTLAEDGGYDPERPAVPGSRVWHADGKTPVPPDQQVLGRAVRVGHLPDTVEWHGPQHDLTPVGWNARRMHNDDGSVLGTVVVCHDLTATLSARRTQEQFLGTVSHELRTPLTSIVGFIDVAESLSPARDSAMHRSLSAIRRNSEELTARVAELLSVAENRLELREERVDLSFLLKPLVDRWRSQCADLGLHLESACDHVVLADVDPHQIVRVVDALISNATKFTPPGGDVHVCLTRDGRHAVFAVADTGVGMSAVDQARAFDRFHRGDAARVEAVQGMGLGLQTVKKIVEAHRGTVVLDTEPGHGTTVTVRVLAAPTGLPVG